MSLKTTRLVALMLLPIGMMGSQVVTAGSEIALLIEMLHENGTVSDAQYQRLQAELKQIQSASPVADSPTQVTESATTPREKSLVIKAPSEAFTAQLGGRLQIDAASYSGDPKRGTATEVRRAYLTLHGMLTDDWAYRFQYNFANTGVDGKGIFDAFVAYQGFDNLTLRAGHFKAPLTLQEATSDNFVTFTERASIEAFSPGRQIGVMANHATVQGSWAVGLFGDAASQKGREEDEAWGLSSRTTWSPINQKGQLIHMGLGVNYRRPSSTHTTRFNHQIETHVAGVNVVDTGVIDQVDEIWKWSGELAGVWGPFAAQAEYISTEVNRDKVSDVHLDGWYLETSYFLTGESRRYIKGHFARLQPRHSVDAGGIGAWQLALRYSELDLNDGVIQGGEAQAVTAGINWFPTSTLRFSANYIDVLEVDKGPNAGAEPRAFQVRSQWAF